MAKSDLQLNKLSFDISGFLGLAERIYNTYLDILSEKLISVIRGEIWTNGNGSRWMRLTATGPVKETRREITENHVVLEAGVDLDELKAKSEETFVRVSVVLHGNLASGPLMTKPGQMTWKKDVSNKSKSTAKSVWLLPGEGKPGAQGFVQIDITKNLKANVEKEIRKYVEDFINNVSRALMGLNLSSFVQVR